MPNLGYDPTGTGRYGTGSFYEGASGVNVIVDKNSSTGTSKYYGEISALSPEQKGLQATPPGSGGDNSSGNGTSSQTNTGNASSAVKVATSNLFIFGESSIAIDSMANLVFEDIGGHELIDITRSDLAYDIQTQISPNQPIQNLTDLSQKYSPKNLIGLQDTLDRYFSTFQISLDVHTPTTNNAIYSIVGSDLVLQVVNVDISNRELVEVEVLSYDTKY